MNKTGITWATMTHNPTIGCSQISEGCDACYAETESIKLSENPAYHNYRDEFLVREVPSRLNEPRKFLTPELVFVGSMGDIFHFEQQAPYRKRDGTIIPGGSIRPEYVAEIFRVCKETPQHHYLFLTKRPHQFLKFADRFSLPPNVSFGVTVESNKWLTRIDALRQIPAKYRFLSIEPLLEDLTGLDKYIQYVDFCIVGGESYSEEAHCPIQATRRSNRFMKPEWALRIRDLCLNNRKHFFFKQWGHVAGSRPRTLLPDISIGEYQYVRDETCRNLSDVQIINDFEWNRNRWQSKPYYDLPRDLLHILKSQKPWLFTQSSGSSRKPALNYRDYKW